MLRWIVEAWLGPRGQPMPRNLESHRYDSVPDFGGDILERWEENHKVESYKLIGTREDPIGVELVMLEKVARSETNKLRVPYKLVNATYSGAESPQALFKFKRRETLRPFPMGGWHKGEVTDIESVELRLPEDGHLI